MNNLAMKPDWLTWLTLSWRKDLEGGGLARLSPFETNCCHFTIGNSLQPTLPRYPSGLIVPAPGIQTQMEFYLKTVWFLTEIPKCSEGLLERNTGVVMEFAFLGHSNAPFSYRVAQGRRHSKW
jgi:hypothetical protein